VIASGEPGPARRVHPVTTGAAGRLGRRVDLGLVGGPTDHGDGVVEAPATVSMPMHPGDLPTATKEALALARELLERAEAARVEALAPEVAADRALARAGKG
jgi:hypothetical protein